MALLALQSGPAMAAKRLVPPSLSLTEPQNVVLVGRAKELAAAGVVFAREVTLHGESPPSVVVRMSEDLKQEIELGRRYIVGYTALRRDPRHRSRDYYLDPEGPRVVEVPGVGPALLEDTAAIRSLVIAGQAGESAVQREILEAILKQVLDPEPRTRLMVLAELALRPELMHLVEGPEITILRQILQEGDLAPLSLGFLMQSVMRLADRPDSSWIAQGCRETIAAWNPQVDLKSLVPGVLRITIQVLAETGNAGDLPLLEPRLASNSPAVGRAAAEAMIALDPVATKAAAERSLASDGLHVDVREVLEKFLREP
jgi:hypothetical protein